MTTHAHVQVVLPSEPFAELPVCELETEYRDLMQLRLHQKKRVAGVSDPGLQSNIQSQA